MNASIIGAGAAGVLHALSLRAHGVRVAHVFDPDEERASGLAELCGARVHASLGSIAGAGSDCVSICSPPPLHVAQAEGCAAGARIVFVEKPIAVTSVGLRRLEQVPRCVPIVQWREGRAIRAVRRAIAEWLLGASPTVCVDMALSRGADYFAEGRGTRVGWGCGALLSVGIHAIDAVCFALGRAVLRSQSFLGPATGDVAERTAGLVVTFAGGALVTLRISFDGGDRDETRMTFCGGGVTATIAGTEADPTGTAVSWRARDAAQLRRLEVIEASVDGSAGSPLLVPYIGHAVAALKAGYAPGECEALPSVRSVLAAHEVALGAYAAADPPCAEASLSVL